MSRAARPAHEPALASQQRAQVVAVDVAHRQVQAALVLARVEDRDDVRVVDVRGDARLADEALAKGRILGQGRRDELQRDRAVEVELRSRGRRRPCRRDRSHRRCGGRRRRRPVAARMPRIRLYPRGRVRRGCGRPSPYLYSPPCATRKPRHPRGRLGSSGRRDRRAARPPACPPPQTRRHAPPPSPRRSGCASSCRAAARATSATCVLQMWGYVAHYEMPNDDPEALISAGARRLPREDRPGHRPGRDPRPAPAAGVRRRGPRQPRRAGPRLVSLAVVLHPARHGALLPGPSSRSLRARRAAHLRGLRHRRDGLLGDSDGAAVVRGERRRAVAGARRCGASWSSTGRCSGRSAGTPCTVSSEETHLPRCPACTSPRP